MLSSQFLILSILGDWLHQRLSEIFSDFLYWHGLIHSRVDLWCKLALSQLLLFLLSKSINLFVIEVFEVLVGDLTKLLVPLQKKVIRSSHVIMFVRIDALDCIVLLEIVLNKKVQNLGIDWDL